MSWKVWNSPNKFIHAILVLQKPQFLGLEFNKVRNAACLVPEKPLSTDSSAPKAYSFTPDFCKVLTPKTPPPNPE